MRINLCNEMAVSGDDSLNPRPQPQADLCHGVPVKGPHHRLHLLDEVLDFVVRLCIDHSITQRRPTQNSPKGCS